MPWPTRDAAEAETNPTSGRPPSRARLAAPIVVLCSALISACAGHSARTEGARTALDEGRPAKALELLNEELDVKDSTQLPVKTSSDTALLLLDRAMVLQELASRSTSLKPREYAWSSRDLEAADKQIEILDLSRSAAADVAKYIFSDDTGPYKAPTYEKLMINTMNMVSYLVRGDLNGAKVEARRLAVMQRYVAEHEGHGASLSGPGSYLAGFTFEKGGDPQEALRFYDEALEYGQYASLALPIQRLAASTTYRSPRIRAILEGGSEATPAAEDDTGEILIVLGYGRVPAKIAKRVPVGLALTYASGALSAGDAAKANYLAAQGLVTWVNYPELGEPRGTWEVPSFKLDGASQVVEGTLAVDAEARRAWDQVKGTVVASAITRMIARAATGELLRRSAGGELGALLSLGTQATLTAVDTPDTRSWATLPARIAIGRVRVKPGPHTVDVALRGVGKRQSINVPPRGFAVMNLTVLH
jgi:uncharacterized protein